MPATHKQHAQLPLKVLAANKVVDEGHEDLRIREQRPVVAAAAGEVQVSLPGSTEALQDAIRRGAVHRRHTAKNVGRTARRIANTCVKYMGPQPAVNQTKFSQCAKARLLCCTRLFNQGVHRLKQPPKLVNGASWSCSAFAHRLRVAICGDGNT